MIAVYGISYAMTYLQQIFALHLLTVAESM